MFSQNPPPQDRVLGSKVRRADTGGQTHATNVTNPVADPGTANGAGPDAEVARKPEAEGAEAVETEA